jgi:hypothetical protein
MLCVIFNRAVTGVGATVVTHFSGCKKMTIHVSLVYISHHSPYLEATNYHISLSFQINKRRHVSDDKC